MRYEECLTLSEGQPALRPERFFEGPRVWDADTLGPDDWTLTIPEEAIAELEAAVAHLRRYQLPLLMLSPALFRLEACAALMQRARRQLDEGVGVVILSRFPSDAWTREEAKAAYWLLGQLMSTPVAQEYNGKIFRDIWDEGGAFERGNERAVTNKILTFHTDNSGNMRRPDYVSLLCQQPALEGGRSGLCSVYSLHNVMARRYPALLERLYQPFYHDRQGIQPPGEPEVLIAPAITYDGERLQARYSMNKITTGYQKMGEALDRMGQDALDAVLDVIDEERLAVEMDIERGQIQVFANKEMLHYRSDFVDAREPDYKRHMVRLWFRNEGTPFFDG